MINIGRKKPSPLIPVSSMSDIGFLLLIFIMLLSLINNRQEVMIEYSRAEGVETTETEHNLEIWIKEDGEIIVEGRRQTEKSLEMIISEAILEVPEVRVHLLADRNTPYGYIDEAVSVLQLLQHRDVSFVVKEDI